MEEAGGAQLLSTITGGVLKKSLRQTKEKSAQTQMSNTLINLFCYDTAKIYPLLGQSTMHICARANGQLKLHIKQRETSTVFYPHIMMINPFIHLPLFPFTLWAAASSAFLEILKVNRPGNHLLVSFQLWVLVTSPGWKHTTLKGPGVI